MRTLNYDKTPVVHIEGVSGCSWRGWADVTAEVTCRVNGLSKPCVIVAVDCYPGVREAEVLPAFGKALSPALTLRAENAMVDKATFAQMVSRNVTDDRVFGVLSCHRMEEFLDAGRLAAARERIAAVTQGVVLLYGVGASLLAEPDVLVYADLARWEIQQRYRSGELCNWLCDNANEEVLRKYKRGFFVDWRVADRHKKDRFARMGYVLDTNTANDPKLITGEAAREAYQQTAAQPFRIVPYFDPGVWGGHWMQEVCGLDRDNPNFAWCFDCVPEENSLLIECDGVTLELPSINVVLTRPVELLGDKVHARFGTEFPIRFDFLDTMGGQNLSLQVHPLTEYIQETFGMHYTQDESYYILDAGKDAGVFLGLKEDVNPPELIADLEQAQETAKFDALRYVNRFPAKKHDHFLIPAGTVHCSGADTMVLEISATPYIFTFKLWDWDRLGLDGKPRPVHIAHGKKNIQWNRRTEWVKKNLVGRVEPIASGDGWREERTGLHEREFIETRRHWFTKPVTHNTNGGVNVLNLVQGEEAIVTSPTGAFKPYVVHYAETFIVPASVDEYVISPTEKSGGELATIKAFVRV